MIFITGLKSILNIILKFKTTMQHIKKGYNLGEICLFNLRSEHQV